MPSVLLDSESVCVPIESLVSSGVVPNFFFPIITVRFFGVLLIDTRPVGPEGRDSLRRFGLSDFLSALDVFSALADFSTLGCSALAVSTGGGGGATIGGGGGGGATGGSSRDSLVI